MWHRGIGALYTHINVAVIRVLFTCVFRLNCEYIMGEILSVSVISTECFISEKKSKP